MIRKGALETTGIQILILDEVDVMLSRGFEQQVRYKSFKTIYHFHCSRLRISLWNLRTLIFNALLFLQHFQMT